ncbi:MULTISPECIES: murein biosynthesis integral membrane protein MurJ [unclassified Streptomyces]|uniref:murein biosynthesis integral membrane protein MurJ n=1 Tax=Streptomyces sp. TN58 TaxID=234612 RepID=UPI000A9BC689|nr:lipid II flippase MurJ [Streptomyces sp. TN58]
MTGTTPWRPAPGPPAGAGPTRVPATPGGDPGRTGRGGAPVPSDPGFVAGRLPGGESAVRETRFGAAGYPGGAPVGLGARVAARTTSASADAPGARAPADGLGGARREDTSAGPHGGGGQPRDADGPAAASARSTPGGRRLGGVRRDRDPAGSAVPAASGGSRSGRGRRGGAEASAEPAAGAPLGRFLAKAAAVTAGLTAAGSLLGLVRDQTIAHLFGAGHASDAFLIAWTVPEMASTLLIEDAMALLMVPAFSHALARRAAGRAGLTRSEARAQDPVRLLVGATLTRLLVLLAVVASVLVAAAPAVVSVLAPGLPDPALAVECTRLTALTVLSFGLAGYFSAALRAHRCFLPPAAIYVSYNVGIIGTMVALHTLWGVRAAAAGVAAGGLLMALVQLPAFIRHVGFGPSRAKRAAAPRSQRDRDRPTLIAFGVIAPVILFAVFRQSQVLVERFLAASLPPGAISHLNYAQKVAQMPMVLSLMLCTVTFPVVAQAMAGGEREKARRRVERDLALASLAVLMGTALVIGYAPQIIQVLFERGAFTHQDTLATASVMRVYGLGLLGHCLVGALSRPFFSTARPTWFPALAMSAGLLVNIVAGAFAVHWWGTYGIAAANAAGISTAAALLLTGLGPRIIAIHVRRVAAGIGRLAVAGAAACATGWIAGPMIPDPLLSAALGCLLVPAMFCATGTAIRALEVTALPAQLSQFTQRFRNAR